MNLRDFLNHKIDCPICNKILTISFHSKRKQKFRYEDGRFMVLFELNSITRGKKTYKVGYSIGLDDNSFYADFFTMDEVKFQNDTQLYLINRFKELNKNLKTYKFYKSCTNCERYTYSSNEFIIDYKNCTIGDLTIDTESFSMIKPLTSSFKIYKMVNFLNSKQTWLSYGEISLDEAIRLEGTKDISKFRLSNVDVKQFIKINIINFTTHDETMKKISNLLVFS